MNDSLSLTAAASSDASAFASLPDHVRQEVHLWQTALAAIQPPLARAFNELARRMGVSVPTVKRKYYAWTRGGKNRFALVNRSKAPATERALSVEFLDYWQALAESYQRKTRPAYRELLRRWNSRMEIPGYDDLEGWPSIPTGWSERNLYRALASRPMHRFHLALARKGESAAASYRPLVLTTRRDLWVGSHLMFDDVWHDLFVADGKQIGRPLDLGCLDYFSGCYIARGGKIRQPEARALLESEMRLFLVSVLTMHGYSPRGTTLVVENATAAIRDDAESLLSDMTGGLITVSRAGLSDGRAKASSQWGKERGGNPRHKAALESLHNLIHNETAALAAQAGLNRDDVPEQTAGLLKYTANILAAAEQLPERAGQLKLPILTRYQWEEKITEIVAHINGRTDHDLEGWEQNTIVDPRLLRARKMSPAEVYVAGRTELQPIPAALCAAILYRDLATTRSVRKRMIETVISDISSESLFYDAHALGLVDDEKYDTVANPFDPSYLWIYDAKGRFLGAAPRLHRVSRGDADALHREMGRVEKIHSELIAPFRQRHLKEASERKALMEHNDAVISKTTPQDKMIEREKNRAARTTGQAAIETLLPDAPAEPTTADSSAITTPDEVDDLLKNLE